MPYNNNTRVLTPNGWVKIQDHPEAIPTGIQEVWCIYLTPTTRDTPSVCIKATEIHKWSLQRAGYTCHLRKHDLLNANKDDFGYNEIAWLKGYRRGGSKRKFLEAKALDIETRYPDWQSSPEHSDMQYAGSFIKGWHQGSKVETRILSTNRQEIEWLMEYAPAAGLTIMSDIEEREQKLTRNGKFERLINVYRVNVWHGGLVHWRVYDLAKFEQSYLTYDLPGKHILEGGILNGL